MAEELNVTQASASLYENGSNIPLDILIKMSQRFGVTTDYLWGVSEKISTPIENITEKEYVILRFYRNLPLKWKTIADMMAETAANRHLDD